jgi:hypothetical protein
MVAGKPHSSKGKPVFQGETSACIPMSPRTSRNKRPQRTDTHQSAPLRPQSATENATGLLPPDPDLADVVAAWPKLPASLRTKIAEMVRSASRSDPPDA